MSNSRRYLKDVFALARREQIALTAGSIAYFTFISLVPLLLLLVAVLSVFRSRTLTAWIISRATRVLAPENAVSLQDIIFDAANQGQTTVISTLVLLWGALLTFRALNSAFGAIYGTYSENSLRRTITDVVVVLFVILLTILSMTVVGGILSLFVRAQFLDTLWPFLLFGILVVVFFPLYYVLPDVDLAVGEAVPGALFAAIAWSILRVFFGYYASVSATVELYGAASTFLVILVWLYVGGFILLLGAILNAVLAGHAEPDMKWIPDGYL